MRQVPTDRILTTFTERHPRAPETGASIGPYDSWNLATHVGDEPAAVASNRGLLARGLQIEPEHLVWMDQVHGSEVAFVDDVVAEPLVGIDAVVTDRPGLALCVLVADCLPVLLADPTAGIVAAVHAGRRGVQLGVVTRAVERMRQLGASDVWARIGPGVCAGCYEVGAGVHDEVVAAVPETRAVTREGRLGLDLRAGVVSQLAAAGVTRISAETACTQEDPRLFSHRRDGVTGRLAGVVMVRV